MAKVASLLMFDVIQITDSPTNIAFSGFILLQTGNKVVILCH